MPFKHFTSKPHASREPLGFSIGKQEFHCTQTVPLGAFLGVAMAEGAKSLVEMVNFIREAIVEEEREIFDAMVNDGDIVVMKKAQDARNGEMVAVWLTDRDETTLKYFYKENGGIRLQPANPAYQPIYVPAEQLEIQGKVVAVVRQLG